MNSFWQTIPVLFLMLCIWNGINGLTTFGTTWSWGRHGMPRALSDPDGLLYADGSPINAVQGMMIRADVEEEFELALCIFITVMVLLLLIELCWMKYLRKKLATLRHENASFQAARSQRQPNG